MSSSASTTAPSGSQTTSSHHPAPSNRTQAIYSSPTSNQMDTALESASKSQLEALIAKHSFPQDLDKALAQLRAEDHEKRVKGLRKELDYIANTNWMYEK